MYAPAPREAKEKWAAFAVVAAVAVGVSFGAHALKKRIKGDAPPEAEPAADTALSDDDPAELPDIDLEPDPNEADGLPPAPGTPAASLKARPSWGRLEDPLRASPVNPYAPQHARPLDLFQKAAPLSGELDRAFVVCRVRSEGHADTLAGDDLHVRATFGSTPTIAADGPEDANLAFVSAPLVTLRKDDAVTFEVFDRDVLGVAALARPTVVYTGGPLATTSAGARAECRALAGAALDGVARLDEAAASGALAQLSRRELSDRSFDWSWPHAEIRLARRATTNLAALVGWDDSRVTSRVSALDHTVAQLERERAAMFQRLSASAGPKTTVGPIAATLEDVDCEDGSCAVTLRLANHGSRPMRMNGVTGPRVYVASAKTGPVPAAVEPPEVALKDIAPKAELEVTLRTYEATEPLIVGVCVDTRCGVLADH